MNILYTVNNGFVPQVGAGICSICENNKLLDEINFFVVSVGISRENKMELEKLTAHYGRKIQIIELGNLQSYFDFEIDTKGWNPIVLARILMAKLLPMEVDKVLYLDGDTIVRGSLSELWNMDLQGKILGMSVEPTEDRKRKNDLGLERYYYYNAGVMLADLNKWRECQADDLVIRFYKDRKGKLFANDQDAINGALKDDICTILPKYNFCNIYYQYSYSFLCRLLKPLPYFSRDEFKDCVENPIIIHYLGEERPWRCGNTHRYRRDYEKYISMTVWKDTPKDGGWKMYFICWRIFNVITKPFPSVRYAIINNMIPYFMKYRAMRLKSGK
jgi:lipopolysaccharide biosynthesis glycosyltransferase